MFDLDEFKTINDRHGHATGDWVLQQVGSACRSVCRKNDLFGRLGGEEFAFLLTGADSASALQLAQDCRRRLAQIDTADTGAKFRITASFGVAATADSGYDFQMLLARAPRPCTGPNAKAATASACTCRLRWTRGWPETRCRT
ncbi:GGDEF domain-containing protein [Arenimonas daejeonensis]|uniref:GGDEF domain-containing protein n=1 Tax=Arenimonas daejeonensis TaxID=370777 RepID=UPI0011BFC014|nr:GGDEF domain-containing protein [Arenimonas daejeonensis]